MAHFELGNIPPDAVNLKAAAYLLINGFVRQNLITRPRHERKRLIFEEAARTLGAKGGPQIVEESYTGLRKFGVWVFAIVQQYALFERSPIRAPVMNNSKNFSSCAKWTLRTWPISPRTASFPKPPNGL